MNGRTVVFAEESERDCAEPSEQVARKIWLLMQLFRNREASFSRYYDKFERDRRSFQRDLQHLRTIGEDEGFQISSIHNNKVALTECEPLRALRVHSAPATNIEARDHTRLRQAPGESSRQKAVTLGGPGATIRQSYATGT